jgi:hypothetical protein
MLVEEEGSYFFHVQYLDELINAPTGCRQEIRKPEEFIEKKSQTL